MNVHFESLLNGEISHANWIVQYGLKFLQALPDILERIVSLLIVFELLADFFKLYFAVFDGLLGRRNCFGLRSVANVIGTSVFLSFGDLRLSVLLD